MFLWKASQAIFLLLMVFVCGMALTLPAWRRWYETISAPVFTVMAILPLAHVLRK